jgi:chemotaxis protein methyltransferase CheR
MQQAQRRRAGPQDSATSRAKDTVTDCTTWSRDAGLNPALFRKFCRIAREQAGIRLGKGKEALVSARVSKRVRKLGLPSIRAYLKYLEADETGEEIVQFLDVITTNFTRFFREPEHFEELKRFVVKRHQEGQREFKLWCTAASTGEEPYSMAMALKGLVDGLGIEFRILATDISTKVLGVARAGVYPDKCVTELPSKDRHRFFVKRRESDGKDVMWGVRPDVRERVVFDRLNLAQPPFPMKGPFDVIFCRNVMIYLEQQIRAGLVAEMERLLRPGGLLIVGHAETLTGIRSGLTLVRPSVYRN